MIDAKDYLSPKVIEEERQISKAFGEERKGSCTATSWVEHEQSINRGVSERVSSLRSQISLMLIVEQEMITPLLQ